MSGKSRGAKCGKARSGRRKPLIVPPSPHHLPNPSQAPHNTHQDSSAGFQVPNTQYNVYQDPTKPYVPNQRRGTPGAAPNTRNTYNQTHSSRYTQYQLSRAPHNIRQTSSTEFQDSQTSYNCYQAPVGYAVAGNGRRKRWNSPLFLPPTSYSPSQTLNHPRPPPAQRVHPTPYQMHVKLLGTRQHQHQATSPTPTPPTLPPTPPEGVGSLHRPQSTPPPAPVPNYKVSVLFQAHRLKEAQAAALAWLANNEEMQQRIQTVVEWSREE